MAGVNGPDRDPRQTPLSADGLLDELMKAGELLDTHHARVEELTAAVGDIAARRTQLEEQRAEEERALVDRYNAEYGKLGMEKADLEETHERLSKRQAIARRKVEKLGHGLHKLAAVPGAERPTVLAYAAYATYGSKFSAEAVHSMTELDEAVRAQAGEPFTIVQSGNLAFGRIADEATGLLVHTEEGRHASNVVELPVASTNLARHGRRKPYFGWLSRSFDHPRDVYETWDSVLGRSAEEEELVNGAGGWSAMSHFNLSEGNLRLIDPSSLRLGEEADAHSEHTHDDGFWDKAGVLFTGETANAFLHRVIDARLTLLASELDSDKANAEFGRIMGVTARLGIGVDVRQVPAHERLIRM